MQACLETLRANDMSEAYLRPLAFIGSGGGFGLGSLDNPTRVAIVVFEWGAYLGAEMNNFGCPWGGTYDEATLEANRAENDAEVGRLIALARAHEDTVFSVAVGNEATVDWTDHFVPVPRMIEHVRRVKAAVRQPVTFCENYVPWQHKLRELAAEHDIEGHEELEHSDLVLKLLDVVPLAPSQPRDRNGQPGVADGILEIVDEGFGFLRVNGVMPSPQDIYAAVNLASTASDTSKLE